VYSGINAMITGLWLHQNEKTDPRFLTPNQIKSLGGHIKKGSKTIPIVFYKSGVKEQENGDMKSYRTMRFYRVLHVSQTGNINLDHLEPVQERQKRTPEQSFTDYDLFVTNCGVPVSHNGSQPMFIPALDQIDLPPISDFLDDDEADAEEHYYSTLFHELTHATGAKHRLDRVSLRDYSKAISIRAYEELIAEIGSAMIGQSLGLQTIPRKDQAAYLKSWIKHLQDDHSLIFKAAADGSKALKWCNEQQPAIAYDIVTAA